MLGCQDFCGYYDWTFHYVRRRFGQRAVHDLWAKAIGGDSQAHYLQAGLTDGLRGLYSVWTQTGKDEQCDWTFTLDEQKNVLRWDMRQCPSKGMLIDNDLHADEDYCDHCMGWMIPLLEKVGVEVTAHEHNHCGQCWGEMRLKDRPSQPLDLPIDIRKDARWKRGHLDRWTNGRKLPVLNASGPDSCDVLRDWFAAADELVVLGRGPSAVEPAAKTLPRKCVLVTDPTYVTRDVFDGEPAAVLIGDRSQLLPEIAHRYGQTEPSRRPLLMHAYLPGVPMLDFVSHGLPRPVPILPQLIRSGLYAHQSRSPYPTSGVFLVLLAVSLGKPVQVAGIDLYQHPSGKTYASDTAPSTHVMPHMHSVDCDLRHLRAALAKHGALMHLTPNLRELLAKT